MDVALATCAVLPEPDFDAEPLLHGLRRAGLAAGSVAWDDPLADFGAARLTLLRSTWNYPEQPEAFAAWAERTARVSLLRNPLEVVRWNLHKRYLSGLERHGVPVTPTEVVPRGSPAHLASIAAARGWDDVVVKPAISAASFRTMRVRAADFERGEQHLRSLVADRDALVQRYLPSTEDYGERALVWIDGRVTHAVRKSPRFEGQDESVSGPMPVARAEAELAARAVACSPARPLYARIDVAPGPDGPPVVMELELIEPSLFFPQGPQALELLVEAIRRTLANEKPDDLRLH